MRALYSIVLLLAVLVFTSAPTACAKGKKEAEQLPPPPPTAEERKENSASQLRGIAARVAERVQLSLGERIDLRGVPVYVRQPLDTRFEQVFYDFLVSELVSRGVKVSVEQQYALVLDYRIVDGVVVTSSLRYNNVYVMQDSSIQFVGDTGVGQSSKNAVWNRFAKRRPVYEP